MHSIPYDRFVHSSKVLRHMTVEGHAADPLEDNTWFLKRSHVATCAPLGSRMHLPLLNIYQNHHLPQGS